MFTVCKLGGFAIRAPPTVRQKVTFANSLMREYRLERTRFPLCIIFPRFDYIRIYERAMAVVGLVHEVPSWSKIELQNLEPRQKREIPNFLFLVVVVVLFCFVFVFFLNGR